MEKIDQKLEKGRWFDEKKAFYDMKKRNEIFMPKEKENDAPVPIRTNNKEQLRSKMILEQILKEADEGIDGLLDDIDCMILIKAIRNHDSKGAIDILSKAENLAKKQGRQIQIETIQDVKQRILSYFIEEERPKRK